MAITTILLALLFIFMLIPASLGLVVFFHVFIRRKKSPVDESNRINHLRLVWFAMTREDEFVKKFDWLKNDEWVNINQNKEEK